MLLQVIGDDLYARSIDAYNPKNADAFEDYEYQWKMADNDSLLNIIEDINGRAKSAEIDAKYTKELTNRISSATEQSKSNEIIWLGSLC